MNTPVLSRPTGTDPYASREGEHSRIVEREDPVLWGDGRGPLDEESLTRFERTGFLCLPSFLTPSETKALTDRARHLLETVSRSSERVVAEPDSDAVRSIFRVHEDDEVFRTFCRSERLAAVARQILGSDVVIHQSRINYKPALDGREFFWHSDFETWHMEDGMPRMRALSASVALTDNDAFNGPLLVVPGSHEKYVRCAGGTPAEHYKKSLARQEYGVPDLDALKALVEAGGIEAPLGPRGTVVFFDSNEMHGSGGNLAPYPRSNLFVVYNSVKNALREPYSGLPPRPDFLADREPEPLFSPGA